MAPQRKSDFSQIVLRALFTGACVSLVNACVAGESAWQSPDFLARLALELWPLRKFLGVGGGGIDSAHLLFSLHRDPLCAQRGGGQLYDPPEHDPQQQQL